MRYDLAGVPEESRSGPLWRSRRALHCFLAASFLAHAAVFIVLPDFSPEPKPAGARVLEVIIMQPQPLPIAAATPDALSTKPKYKIKPKPKPKPKRKPEVKQIPSKDASREAIEWQTPGLALPRQEPETAATTTSAPSSTPVPSPSAPVPGAEAELAGAPVTPPNFTAGYLSNPSPRYPQAARRAGEQGTVTLRVLVKTDGIPSRVEIESSSSSRHLDTAAQDAVRRWRFVPARRGADPIESWVLVPIVFRLESAS
jgi:periplasmic protein TonB